MAISIEITVHSEALQRTLAMVASRLAPETLLKLIGERHLNWINENFRKGGAEQPWRPLSANTIAARRKGKGRGGPQPLRDTGRLAQSFVKAGVQIRGDSVAVGTEDQRAIWHHLGTRPYEIRPVRAKRLKFVTTEGEVFARKVSHPGLPARPLLPSRRLAEALALQVTEAAVAKVLREQPA